MAAFVFRRNRIGDRLLQLWARCASYHHRCLFDVCHYAGLEVFGVVRGDSFRRDAVAFTFR